MSVPYPCAPRANYKEKGDLAAKVKSDLVVLKLSASNFHNI